MDTPRTSDNTKVPDFSFFDLRQIKTWKTEQLACIGDIEALSHLPRKWDICTRLVGAGLGAVFYAGIKYIYITGMCSSNIVCQMFLAF